MNLRRLKLLEKAVEAEPPKLFDMGVWERRKSCGTVHCAAGAFAVRYPRQGLKLKKFPWYVSRVPTTKESGPMLEGIDACAVVFEIELEDATRLFAFGSYARPDKRSVLARIRSYIRKAKRERAKS